MKYAVSISILAMGALVSLQPASAQTLTDVLVGTTINTGMNAENVRAMQEIKADARAGADALNAYQATLDAEMLDSASPASPSPNGTVSGGEVKVRTVVSVVPDTATRTPKVDTAADPALPINIVLSREDVVRRAATSATSTPLAAIRTDEEALAYATEVLVRDPAITAIAMTEGKTVIARRDTIALFWFLDLDTTIEITVDQKEGRVDVDLPWWAKLAGKSEKARALEALDPLALSRAVSSTKSAGSAARALAIVTSVYAGDTSNNGSASGRYVAIGASGTVSFATSSAQ